MDRINRRVWETAGKMREKTRTKWVLELKKDWTEMEIKMEVKDNRKISRHQQICWSLMTEKDTGTVRVEKHHWGRQEKRIMKISEAERQRRKERMKKF